MITSTLIKLSLPLVLLSALILSLNSNPPPFPLPQTSGLLVRAPIPDDPQWYKRTQVYGMLPLWPDDALTLGLTLNGLWGGYFWASPIRQGNYMYASDAEQVNAFHQAGLRLSGVIDASGAYTAQLDQYPDLRQALDTRINGEPAIYGDYHFMCLDDPDWLTWQIEEGKRIIDANADSITIDNFVPLSRALLLGSLSLPGSTPGFCDATLNAFRRTVTPELPYVSALSNDELRRSLGQSELYLYGGSSVKNELMDYFWPFYEQASYTHMEQLTTALRAYGRELGRNIIISGNSPLTGLRLGANEEYSLDTYRYWGLVDFFASEFSYDSASTQDPLWPLPGRKMVAWYKAGWAIKKTPNVFMFNSSSDWPQIFTANLRNFYAIRMAESYANRQALALYTSPEDPSKIDFFRPLAGLATFITANQELFDQTRDVYADTVVIYFSPKQDTWPTYEGLTLALADSNLQFETLIASDATPLTVDRLMPFQTVVVATLKDMPLAGIQVLNEYVTLGGTVVVFDDLINPALLDNPRIRLVGTDLGRAYLTDHFSQTRQEIRNWVMQGTTPRVTLEAEGGKVSAFAYQGNGKLIVHLVNYDHQFNTDQVIDKGDFYLRLRSKIGYQQATLLSPDFSDRIPLTVEHDDGETIRVKIPRLHIYDIIVLSSEQVFLPLIIGGIPRP